jgi:hypothetical protein
MSAPGWYFRNSPAIAFRASSVGRIDGEPSGARNPRTLNTPVLDRALNEPRPALCEVRLRVLQRCGERGKLPLQVLDRDPDGRVAPEGVLGAAQLRVTSLAEETRDKTAADDFRNDVLVRQRTGTEA